MKSFIVGLLMVVGVSAHAQFSRASLQASGLTCSMCSKAVKNALEKVPFVNSVQVDIKNQEYNLSFKPNSNVDFDALGKAVEDAGFSVASLKATAVVNNLQLKKDEHVNIGSAVIHVLNSSGQQVNGETTFTLVDKPFVSSKAFKKYASLSQLPCVQTGRMAKCCKANASEPSRIYHAII